MLCFKKKRVKESLKKKKKNILSKTCFLKIFEKYPPCFRVWGTFTKNIPLVFPLVAKNKVKYPRIFWLFLAKFPLFTLFHYLFLSFFRNIPPTFWVWGYFEKNIPPISTLFRPKTQKISRDINLFLEIFQTIPPVFSLFPKNAINSPEYLTCFSEIFETFPLSFVLFEKNAINSPEYLRVFPDFQQHSPSTTQHFRLFPEKNAVDSPEYLPCLFLVRGTPTTLDTPSR